MTRCATHCIVRAESFFPKKKPTEFDALHRCWVVGRDVHWREEWRNLYGQWCGAGRDIGSIRRIGSAATGPNHQQQDPPAESGFGKQRAVDGLPGHDFKIGPFFDLLLGQGHRFFLRGHIAGGEIGIVSRMGDVVSGHVYGVCWCCQKVKNVPLQ